MKLLSLENCIGLNFINKRIEIILILLYKIKSMINYFHKVFFLTKNVRKNIIFIFILIIILSILDLFGIYLFIPLISKLLNDDKLFNNFYLEDILINADLNTIIFFIFIIFFFKSIFHILFIAIKSNLIKELTSFLSKNLHRRYLLKK